jgi:hypothetical protein
MTRLWLSNVLAELDVAVPLVHPLAVKVPCHL